jgi:hypothetical protein
LLKKLTTLKRKIASGLFVEIEQEDSYPFDTSADPPEPKPFTQK